MIFAVSYPVFISLIRHEYMLPSCVTALLIFLDLMPPVITLFSMCQRSS